MPTSAGERAIKESIVQFLDAQGSVRGCGLLVDSWHVLSCAHVVALVIPGVKSDQTEKPEKEVRVKFPYSDDAVVMTAKVVVWKPVMQGQPFDMVEDIAVLTLQKTAPAGTLPHGVLLVSDWAGRGYMVHGFPESNTSGDWADGDFKGEQVSGWVQMLTADGTDLQVDHGFSGGGVWDEQLREFGGILVANKKRGGQLKPVCHMITGIILKKAWQDLPILQHRSSAEPSLSYLHRLTPTEDVDEPLHGAVLSKVTAFPLQEIWPVMTMAISANVIAGATVFETTRGLLFLDTIGTCFAARALGPWYGAACGAFSNVITALLFGFDNKYYCFALVNAVLGFYWGLLSVYRPSLASIEGQPRFGGYFRFLAAYGLGAVVVTAVTVAPINLAVLDLVVKRPIQNHVLLYDAIRSAFSQEGQNYWCYILSDGFYGGADKVASVFIALVLVLNVFPLYRKNVELFHNVRSCQLDFIGPFLLLCGAVFSIFLALVTLDKGLILALLWCPLVAICLFCIAYQTLFLSDADWSRRHQVRCKWNKTYAGIEQLRQSQHISGTTVRCVVVCVMILLYYLLWFLFTATYEFSAPEDQKVLSNSLLRLLGVLGILFFGLLILFRVVCDNIFYVVVTCGKKGESES